MIKRLFGLFIILILVGCEPGIIDAPTPTQEILQPSETPEAPLWDVSCLPDGIVPLNKNPCLVPEPGTSHPHDVDWIVAPNGMWGDFMTYPEWAGDHWVWHLAGNEGERFAGFIGLRIHNLVLKAGQCYALNLTGRLGLRSVPNDELTDISAQAFIYTDGGKRIPLNVHAVFYKDGLNFVVNESPDWFWSFWVMADATIVIDVGIYQVHANARPGGVFVPDAVYIHPVNDPGLCAGAPIS